MSNQGKPCPKKRSCLKFLCAFWMMFPHVCLVCSLVLYSILGAVVFTILEGSRNQTFPEFDTFITQLWDLSQNSCTVKEDPYAQEYFKNISKELIVNNVQSGWLQKPEIQWRFLGSLFFCCTVFTTVGYGNTFPVTFPGKMACMVYAAIGIPLMLLVLADLGDLLAACLSSAYKKAVMFGNKQKQKLVKRFHRRKSSGLDSTLDSRVSLREPLNLTDVLKSQSSVRTSYLKMRNIEIFEHIIDKEKHRILAIKCRSFQRCHSCPELDLVPLSHSVLYNFDKIGEELEQLDVPILLIILIMLGYIMCGALIFPIWEQEWTFSDAFYFCFITLTTIGFGDIVPHHPNYFLLSSAYLVVGMAIVCMAFKLVQNRLVSLYKQCIICISGGKVTQYSRH